MFDTPPVTVDWRTIYLTCAGTLLTGGLLILLVYIRFELAWRWYVKVSRGLPMAGGRSALLGNHLVWQVCRGNVEFFKNEHKRLGVQTVGYVYGQTPVASTIDLDLIKSIIYGNSNRNINRRKYNLPWYELENGILLAEDDHWRKLRRCITPALRSSIFKSPNVMQEIEDSIKKVTDFIEHRLEQESKSTGTGCDAGVLLEIDELTHRHMLDLFFSCFFKQYNLIDFYEEHCGWIEIMDIGAKGIRSHPLIRLGMLFPSLLVILDKIALHIHPASAYRKRLMNFVKAQTKLAIEARREIEAQRAQRNATNSPNGFDADNFKLLDGTHFKRNMIDFIIDQFLEGRLARDDYFTNVHFLFTAADKTTADALAHILYLVALHQDVQERMRKSIELDGAESEYLGWVISESLRLLPPSTVGCSRTIKDGLEISGGKHYLPAGTYVVTNTFLIHRLEQYWGKDAEEFKPERWRDTSHHHPMQYMPFGAGIRGCPGKELALFELRQFLSKILVRYRLETKFKPDAYTFDSPFLMFTMPNSPTFVLFKRIAPLAGGT